MCKNSLLDSLEAEAICNLLEFIFVHIAYRRYTICLSHVTLLVSGNFMASLWPGLFLRNREMYMLSRSGQWLDLFLSFIIIIMNWHFCKTIPLTQQKTHTGYILYRRKAMRSCDDIWPCVQCGGGKKRLEAQGEQIGSRTCASSELLLTHSSGKGLHPTSPAVFQCQQFKFLNVKPLSCIQRQ